MNITNIIFLTAVVNAAVVVAIVWAYRDANRILKWHRAKHRHHAWINQAPRPSLVQRIVNTFLFIANK
jgi:hypothetical protein